MHVCICMKICLRTSENVWECLRMHEVFLTWQPPLKISDALIGLQFPWGRDQRSWEQAQTFSERRQPSQPSCRRPRGQRSRSKNKTKIHFTLNMLNKTSSLCMVVQLKEALNAGANFKRNNFRVKFHLTEFLWTFTNAMKLKVNSSLIESSLTLKFIMCYWPLVCFIMEL